MNDGSKGSQDGPPKGLSWTQTRLVRLTQGGPKGMQASAIGFVLAGPIVGGFLIGWWIDQKFGTQFWVLILGLLGVYSGFRETFALLKNLQPTQYERTPPPGRDKIVPKAPPTLPEQTESAPQQRLFKVPPPPFMESASPEKSELRQPQNAEEVLRKLMGKEDDQKN